MKAEMASEIIRSRTQAPMPVARMGVVEPGSERAVVDVANSADGLTEFGSGAVPDILPIVYRTGRGSEHHEFREPTSLGHGSRADRALGLSAWFGVGLQSIFARA